MYLGPNHAIRVVLARDAVISKNQGCANKTDSSKQYRRQPLSPFDRRFVGRAPCIKELYQLLAGAVLVPFAVTLDDFEQLMGRFRALAGGVERGRQVKSRLMIKRVCGDFLFELRHRAE